MKQISTDLIHNSASADGEVSDLAVPHEAGRKTHSQATGIYSEVLSFGQRIHHRGFCILYGIAYRQTNGCVKQW